jgi:hypothetical protein
MASLRGTRYWWFLTWYIGGTAFIFYLQDAVVSSTGIPAVWGFAFAFAVLFTMTFGVGYLIRWGRRSTTPK